MSKFLKFFIWIIFFISIFITIISIFRGIILNDEGYIINSAVRLLNGQVMYRDFHFAYTPGSVYITALIFSLFGTSLFAERVGTILLTIITSLLLYALGFKITVKKTYSFLPVLIFLAWGPTHINFLWPVMFSIPIGLAACLYLIKATETKKNIYLFIAGCLTVILFLFKQNFGLGLLIIFCVLFFFQKELRSRANVFFYTAGVIVISAIFTGYLFATHSLNAFIQDMYDYTIARIIIEHALDTPFFYGATLLQKLGKAVLYLFPLYLSVLSFMMSLRATKERRNPVVNIACVACPELAEGSPPRNDSSLIILPLFCIMFFLLGIRPTTDYVHLAPLLAITSLPLLLIMVNAKQKFIKGITGVVFAILIFSGFYTAFFVNFYRWQKPLWQHTEYQNDKKLGISLSKNNADEIRKIKSTVNDFTPDDRQIYVYDYQPMIYFLTKKQNPTKFDLLAQNGYFIKAMPQIAQILKEKKVKLIITNKSFDNDKTLLAVFIRTNYQRIGKSQNFYFWRIKP